MPGYEGLYEVSSRGAVKSLPRPVRTKTGKTFIRRGRTLKPNSVQGRNQYTLYDSSGVSKIWKSSRLVLFAFEGFPPEGKPWALHWDDDPGNNHVSNLRWGSPSENTRDSVRNGTHADSLKRHCPSGHEYSEDNTRVSKKGKRTCRVCDKVRQQRVRDLKKGASNGV